jgi:hypothetical protein
MSLLIKNVTSVSLTFLWLYWKPDLLSQNFCYLQPGTILKMPALVIDNLESAILWT